MPHLPEKIPGGTTIFTVMSQLAAEHGAINLSQGFPDFDPPRALIDAACRHLDGGHNQYAPMTGVPALRAALADVANRRYGGPFDADTDITVVPGATEAIFCAVQASVGAGDEVIAFDPCYDSYEPAVCLAGGRIRRLPLRAPEFTIDWDRVADAIGPRTRMIMINSPHNPTGATLGEADLDALKRLTRNTDIVILSDEVYEYLVFDGRRHHSVLADEELRARSFAVFSFGKTFHATGWKTGYCIAPPALSQAFRQVHQFVTFVAVTPLQWALADFITAHPDHFDSLGPFYQSKRDHFCAGLARSRFALAPSAGTYFQLADYGAISDETDVDFCRRLTTEYGVAAIPVSVFCSEPVDYRFVRFCFAKREQTLDAAVARLQEL